MELLDINIITRTLNALVNVLSLGYGRTLPQALWLLSRFATLELVLVGIWWAMGHQETLSALISRMLWFGLLLWFLMSWPLLTKAFVDSLIKAGLVMGGGQIEVKDFLNPSAILQQGFRLTDVIFARIASYTGVWTTIANLPETIILGVAAFFIWAGFFVLAAQVFMQIIQFYIMSLVVVILLPFGAFKHTAFLAEKAFAVVIGSGMALCILAIITSIALPVVATIQMSNPPKLNDAFTMLAISLLIGLLSWQATSIAAGVMAGAPSLSAAHLAGGAIAAGATAALGMAGIVGASRAIMGTTQMATSAGAAVISAARSGGLAGGGIRTSGGIGGVAGLVNRASSDMIAAIGKNFISAGQRGAAYGRGEPMPATSNRGGRSTPVWAMQMMQRAIPAQGHPQGGAHVPIHRP